MDFLDPSMNQLPLPGMEGMQSKATAPKPVKKEKKETTADKLQQGQLPMFLGAQEIIDNYLPLPGDYKSPMETKPELWKRKAQEAREGSPGDARSKTTKETLAESVAKSGVQQPITLGTKAYTNMGADKPFVFGGHHRVAIAREIDPNMVIPVTNADEFHESTTMKKKTQGEGNPFRIGSGDRLNY